MIRPVRAPSAPAPLGLARCPTPVQALSRLPRALGLDDRLALTVKRDDLTGFGLSGNKVRKLDRLLAEARSQGAQVVLTTGGIQSNHCRATAVAARRLGLDVVLLLRGEPPAVPDANLLLDTLLGAEVHWCTADDYRHRRDALLAELAEGCRAGGRVPYVVPEGGSNALGSLGFVDAAAELEAQGGLEDLDGILVAVGSGGTLAGLALAGLPCPVWGVAVCDDRATFRARVQAIGEEATARFGRPPLPPPSRRTWEVIEGYQGPGYAKTTPATWRLIQAAARHEGLLLDPVYTGKALAGLVGEARAGRLSGRWLLWHTGGAFGLFGRGAELVGAGAS